MYFCILTFMLRCSEDSLFVNTKYNFEKWALRYWDSGWQNKSICISSKHKIENAQDVNPRHVPVILDAIAALAVNSVTDSYKLKGS